MHWTWNERKRTKSTKIIDQFICKLRSHVAFRSHWSVYKWLNDIFFFIHSFCSFLESFVFEAIEASPIWLRLRYYLQTHNSFNSEMKLRYFFVIPSGDTYEYICGDEMRVTVLLYISNINRSNYSSDCCCCLTFHR